MDMNDRFLSMALLAHFEESREALASRDSSNVEQEFEEEGICEECGHTIELHEAEYGCDYEADRPDPDIGQVAWRCGCRAYVFEKEQAKSE